MKLTLQLCVLFAFAGPDGVAQARDPVFVRGASAETVASVLYPWTQEAACSCCVCWQTALGTLLAYWDDHANAGAGPFESLIPGGNGDRASAMTFEAMTLALQRTSGAGCQEGITLREVARTASAYTNLQLGYDFSTDLDTVVWWHYDLVSEIDAHRPLLLAADAWDGGREAHAVVVVGYETDERSIYLYDNHRPWVQVRMFDELERVQLMSMSPGGRADVPSHWSCASRLYEDHGDCQCGCGVRDPDCDHRAAPVSGCGQDQICTPEGTCELDCARACASRQCGWVRGCLCGTCAESTQCDERSGRCVCEYVECAGQCCSAHASCHAGRCCVPATCSELGVACGRWPDTCGGTVDCPGCDAASFCDVHGVCRPRCQHACAAVGDRRCHDGSAYQTCLLDERGCRAWSDCQLCPAGTACGVGGLCRRPWEASESVPGSPGSPRLGCAALRTFHPLLIALALAGCLLGKRATARRAQRGSASRFSAERTLRGLPR